jgi:hypothetical protein
MFVLGDTEAGREGARVLRKEGESDGVSETAFHHWSNGTASSRGLQQREETQPAGHY